MTKIVCNLHDVGVEVDVIEPELVDAIRGVLKKGLDEGNGVVGFGTVSTSWLDYTY